ncbi:MAG: hypothetical protein ACI86M_003593, partial [Saprospiraceae bacterium]
RFDSERLLPNIIPLSFRFIKLLRNEDLMYKSVPVVWLITNDEK